MKITVTFNDGSVVSAFVSEEQRERLESEIIENNGLDDVSEIEESEYAYYAVSDHAYLRIFDAQYDADEIASWEIDFDSEESEEDHLAKLQEYAAVYPQALEYAYEFFTEMVRVLPFQPDGKQHKPELLPIVFVFDEILHADSTNGCCTIFGKQAVIRVRIRGKFDELLKQTIRHEIIHYTLWLAGLPSEDDDAEFWALSAVFDAQPYKIFNQKNRAYYNAFKAYYDGYLKDMNDYWGQHLAIGNAVHLMSKCESVEAYEAALEKEKK